jgi:hypothetical protein
LGNEAGITVTFTCNANVTPGPGPGPQLEIATITRCSLDRDSTGTFALDVIGTNIKAGALVTVGGQSPKKIKFKDLVAGSSNTFTRVTLKKGGLCSRLPGAIVITNPGPTGGASQPFQCAERCPTN